MMIDFNRKETENGRPIFEPGELVQHRRYAYRGVVVDRDEFCLADEDWYRKNRTQPERDQPWYHVLVHGTATCTYAAAENLMSDLDGSPIEHPLLPHFFVGFEEGAYVRNEEPWPGL